MGRRRCNIGGRGTLVTRRSRRRRVITINATNLSLHVFMIWRHWQRNGRRLRPHTTPVLILQNNFKNFLLERSKWEKQELSGFNKFPSFIMYCNEKGQTVDLMGGRTMAQNAMWQKLSNTIKKKKKPTSFKKRNKKYWFLLLYWRRIMYKNKVQALIF